MKNRYSIIVILIATAAFFVPTANAVSQSKIPELTLQEINKNTYTHVGDLSFSNVKGTAANAILMVQNKAIEKGAGFYRVTRLELMPNSNWSINAALYN